MALRCETIPGGSVHSQLMHLAPVDDSLLEGLPDFFPSGLLRGLLPFTFASYAKIATVMPDPPRISEPSQPVFF